MGLSGYGANAPELIARYEAIDFTEKHERGCGWRRGMARGARLRDRWGTLESLAAITAADPGFESFGKAWQLTMSTRCAAGRTWLGWPQ
jgi:hypothetical protein